MLQNVHFDIVAFRQLVGIPFDLFDMIVFILIRCWWAKFWRPGSQSLSDQKTEARVWSESLVRKGIEPYNNADYSVFIKSWRWLCYPGIYYLKTHTIQTSKKRKQNKHSYYLKTGAACRYIVLILYNLKWAIWAINSFTAKCGQRQISTKFPHFIF